MSTAEEKATEALEIAERVQGWGRDHYVQIGSLKVKVEQTIEEQIRRVDREIAQLQAARQRAEQATGEALRARDRLLQEAEPIFKQLRDLIANFRAEVELIAWTKAGDRIELWYREMASYRDPRLLNLIYSRVLKHLHRLGIKDTSGVKVPSPTGEEPPAG